MVLHCFFELCNDQLDGTWFFDLMILYLYPPSLTGFNSVACSYFTLSDFFGVFPCGGYETDGRT